MKLHRHVAAWFGYELIKKRKLNDTLEQHLRNVLTFEDIDLVIDVGANVGQYARSLRRNGYAGRIASFEPLASAFASLREHSNLDPHWHAYPFAVGASRGHVVMRRYAASDFSSVLEVNQFAQERFRWRTNLEGHEEVEMVTLESHWPEIAAFMETPRALLKLDTQGFDLEVLAGAGHVLQHVSVIQAELSLKSIYKGAPRYLEALAQFENRGFEVTGMYPVSRDNKSLAVVEYDCVMARRK